MILKFQILEIANIIRTLMIAFAFLFADCQAQTADLPYPLVGETLFVSSTFGNDQNDGHSTETPLKTIKRAMQLGDSIYLKAGDIFYESEIWFDGKKLSRYGTGPNPTVCGFKRIKSPNWVRISNNVWKLNLLSDNYIGFVTVGPSFSNNICAFHDYENDLIHGRKVRYFSEMEKDWDFWQTETLSNAQQEEYNEVYLFLSSDPNLLKLEMSIYDGALLVSNSVVDGVNFEGFGFGISVKSNTKIRNCRVDAIGGRIIPEGDNYNCYGNGIEFYVGGVQDIENCIVENCFVSRCYDCGITIQGSGGTTATPRNISIRNNLITNCCQGWEDFLRNNSDVFYENCIFSNNIVLHSGNTSGFGYQNTRFKFCHILGNNILGDKGMKIEDNVFADGNYYCSGVYNNAYRSNLWVGNKCYLESGYFILGEYFGNRDVLRVGRNKRSSSSELIRYRKLTGDHSTKFFIKSKRRVMSKANNLEKSFLRTHSF